MEQCKEVSEVVIDVFDHAVAGGGDFVVSFIEKALFVFFTSDEGAVRSIEGDVSEVGFLFFVLFFDPSLGGIEEDVGAESFGADDGFVVKEDVVEVGSFFVWREVAESDLSNATGAVHEDFVEATALWKVFVLIAEVPFAKESSGVASGLEHLREGKDVEGHAFALQDGVADSDVEGETATHYGGPSGGAGGTDLKVGETRGLGVKLVEVGSL